MADLPVNQIVQGDCLEVMAGWPDGCVDVVVTDPPYFLPAAHYQTRRKSVRSLSDLSMLEHFYRDVFREMARLTKDNGFWYVFCDGQSYPVFYTVAYPVVKKARPLIWDKCTSMLGYTWRHQHELILFAQMEGSPAIETGDGDILRERAVPVDKRLHLAQKPVSLLRRLLAKATPAGGLVLDPFVGSGSTCIAAQVEGKSWLAIEKDENYCAIARRRLAEHEPLLRTLEEGEK